MSRLVAPAVGGNVHLQKLTTKFGRIEKAGKVPPAYVRFVFICFTNRCGSNYLAELLASSGTYNLAGEFLNWNTVEHHADAYELTSLQDYFAWLATHRSKSGFLFVKTASSQLELLVQSGILDGIVARSTFLLMERSDKLGQAISHALAFMTGRYTSYMQGSKAPETVEFSRKLVQDLIDGTAKNNWEFDQFFGWNGIQPINIVYEQLVRNPGFFLQMIATAAVLPHSDFTLDGLRLEKQSDHVNARWRDLYLSGR